jgi:hypothetical protein
VKKLGGYYVQQAVCVLPDREELRAGLERVRDKVTELGGSSVFLTLTDVDADAREQFVEGLRGQSAKEYAEIADHCEAIVSIGIANRPIEDLRTELDKLERRLAKAVARDWMDADGKEIAQARVAAYAGLLSERENDVRRSG